MTAARLSTPDGLEVVVHRLAVVGGLINYLSMGGSREEVEAVWATLAKGGTLLLKGEGKQVPLSPPRVEMYYRKARVGKVYHGLVVSKSVREGNSIIWRRDEEAAKALAWALRLPILPEWVAPIEEMIERKRPTETISIGVKIIYIPSFLIGEIQEGVRKLLREGQLPLPPGVKGTMESPRRGGT